jgi:DNA-binding GntR family transcriptional regulator
MDAPAEPARKPGEVPSLTDVAYGWLHDGIVAGRIAAGSSLRQEEIAAKLGISRLPVREALRRLEVEGLVLLRPRRGYTVASLNREEFEEVYDLRAILEERAGYCAALHRRPEDIESVEAALTAFDAAINGGAVELTDFGQHNSDFHARLFAAGGQPHLTRLLRVLRPSVERYARMGASFADDLSESRAEHHRIFDAFRDGDAARCAQLCREHCERIKQRMIEYVSRQRP